MTIGTSREVIVLIPPGVDDWMADLMTESAFTDAWLMEQIDRDPVDLDIPPVPALT